MLAEFIVSLGFKKSRYDGDVWMQLRENKDEYDYICTHVNDFMIVARDPRRWLDPLQEHFLLKTAGPPKTYLGNYLVNEEEIGIRRMG